MTSSATLPAPRTTADELVVALLKAHIPLTLLMDLIDVDPRSSELYAQEYERDALSWCATSAASP